MKIGIRLEMFWLEEFRFAFLFRFKDFVGILFCVGFNLVSGKVGKVFVYKIYITEGYSLSKYFVVFILGL